MDYDSILTRKRKNKIESPTSRIYDLEDKIIKLEGQVKRLQDRK